MPDDKALTLRQADNLYESFPDFSAWPAPTEDAQLCKGGTPLRQRDVSDIAGTWQEDPEFDQAVADQDRVDEGLWR
jgi:hypothetical protein